MRGTPYLRDIPLDEAIRIFYEKLDSISLYSFLGVETIPLDENAAGRVLAESLTALRCSPHYHASAMDGFAVRSVDTSGALPSNPRDLKMGVFVEYADTGDALPAWADAVIPVEDAESLDVDHKPMEVGRIRSPHFIRIRAAVPPWSHVRTMGEDLINGQLILPAGERLRAVDLGAAAAGGVSRLAVARKPKVAILPTGDELITVEKEPIQGQITEFNSIVTAALIEKWGGKAKRYPITRDELDEITQRIRQAASENDLVLVNAGSSAGKDDYTAQAVEILGEVLVHGIAVRPGHPVVIGFVHLTVSGGKRIVPVIGIPGYPVSAVMTCEILVRPLLETWLGVTGQKAESIEAFLTRKITSTAGDDDYVRVILGKVNDRMLATPISRGAGVTTSLTRADGTLHIPRMIQGIEAGEKVTIQLYRTRSEIARNILSIGSHDLTLDVLALHLIRLDRRLVTSNVGSLGGLIALKKGETHFSGCHLLDPETGGYNDAEIHRLLPDQRITVLGWVGREQGLMVRKSNPKKLTSLEDLRREDVTFINRQRGAGTRVLLDYHLRSMSIDPEVIHGYFQEEYTHLGVGVAVATGRADCGLGVRAAADSLDLDFISLFDETYELVFAGDSEKDAFLEPVFSLSMDSDFIKDICRLPGYNVAHMGEIRFVNT